jgi:hypothetical protein
MVRIMGYRKTIARNKIIPAAVLAACIVAGSAADVMARSSVWISSRDSNSCIVSAVFQYDKKFESDLRKENGIESAILRMDINTKEPAELCNMLMMVQGEVKWRPLICVQQARGNIYKGYLVLPEEFVLYKPIEIYLGDRKVDANFIK